MLKEIHQVRSFGAMIWIWLPWCCSLVWKLSQLAFSVPPRQVVTKIQGHMLGSSPLHCRTWPFPRRFASYCAHTRYNRHHRQFVPFENEKPYTKNWTDDTSTSTTVCVVFSLCRYFYQCTRCRSDPGQIQTMWSQIVRGKTPKKYTKWENTWNVNVSVQEYQKHAHQEKGNQEKKENGVLEWDRSQILVTFEATHYWLPTAGITTDNRGESARTCMCCVFVLFSFSCAREKYMVMTVPVYVVPSVHTERPMEIR